MSSGGSRLLVFIAVLAIVSAAAPGHGHSHGPGKTCSHAHSHSHGPAQGKAPCSHAHGAGIVPESVSWSTFATAVGAALLVSVVSTLGMLMVQYNQSAMAPFQSVIVSFGAGAMIGSSLLGFLPEAIHLINDPGRVGLAVLVGVLSALVIEILLHNISAFGHSHGANLNVSSRAQVIEQVASSGPADKVGSVEVVCHEHQSRSDSHKLESMAWNMLFGDALHNMVDGILIGTTFSVSIQQGWITTFVIMLHELPSEIAELCILLHVGWPMRKALIRNAASTLTIVAGCIIGLSLSTQIEIASQYCLAFVAGEFLYIALGQLLPSMGHEHSRSLKLASNVAFAAGIAAMWALAQIHSH